MGHSQKLSSMVTSIRSTLPRQFLVSRSCLANCWTDLPNQRKGSPVTGTAVALFRVAFPGARSDVGLRAVIAPLSCHSRSFTRLQCIPDHHVRHPHAVLRQAVADRTQRQALRAHFPHALNRGLLLGHRDQLVTLAPPAKRHT